MPATRAEDRGRGLAVAILGLAMVVAVVALTHWGRGQVMTGDDLYYAQRLSENSLGHAILHSNLYLLALPMVLYKAMFEVLGIGDYLPYRLVAIALSLLCVGPLLRDRAAPDREPPRSRSIAPPPLLRFRLGALDHRGQDSLAGRDRVGPWRDPRARARGSPRRCRGGGAPLRLGDLASERAGIPRRGGGTGRVPAPATTVEVLLGGCDPCRPVRRLLGLLSAHRRERPSDRRLGRARLRRQLLDDAHRRGLGALGRAGRSGLRPVAGGNRIRGPPRRGPHRRRPPMEEAPAHVLRRGRGADHAPGGASNVARRVPADARRAPLPVPGRIPLPVGPGRAGRRLAGRMDHAGGHPGRGRGYRSPACSASGRTWAS